MNARSQRYFRRNRLRLAAFALAPAIGLAASALPFTAPAAQAAPAVGGCPVSNFCAWQNSGYGGTRWDYQRQTGFWWYVGAAANDQISSFQNNRAAYAYIAKDCPAASDWTWIDAGSLNSNLAGSKWQDGSSINDSITAVGEGAVGQAEPTEPAHGSRTNGGC
jgi:hypothetical protein